MKKILRYFFKLFDIVSKILRNIIPNLIGALLPTLLFYIISAFIWVIMITILGQLYTPITIIVRPIETIFSNYGFVIIYVLVLLSLFVSDFYGKNWFEELRKWSFSTKK